MDKIKAYSTCRLNFAVAQTIPSLYLSHLLNLGRTVLAGITCSISPASTSAPSLFYLKNDVVKAEKVWSLHRTTSHQSLRSSGNAVELFKLMFPDSGIAGKL